MALNFNSITNITKPFRDLFNRNNQPVTPQTGNVWSNLRATMTPQKPVLPIAPQVIPTQPEQESVFKSQSIPQVKSPVVTSTPAVTGAQTAPKAPIITPTQPVTPVQPPVAPVTPSTTPEPTAPATPAVPTLPQISPEALSALQTAQQAYEQSLKLSPEQLSTQEDIDRLVESTKKAYLGTSGQAIPLEFITGQLRSIEQRATALAEPLERKLARLQAARTASLEASKFALERAESAVTSERQRAQEERTFQEGARRFGIEQAGTAESRAIQRESLAQQRATSERDFQLKQRQFEEDKRQFGLNYALAKQKQDTEAAEKAKTASGTQTETLGNYQVVNELLENPSRGQITGLQGPAAFFPGTQAQDAKNKYDQIVAILSLENRQKLKGSGAISDFEAITLEKASSSLRRNLSNEAFDRELKKIRSVFATAAGLSTPVKIIDPKTKKTIDEGSLKRDEINSAISQGFTVEYQ